jgi:hypothetical protein
MRMILLAALVAFQAACAPVQRPAPVAAHASIIAEAQAFMAGYARDLIAGDRAAIAARYDRRGAYRMGNGVKQFAPYAQIVSDYATDWGGPPAAFEWQDLSYEPISRDAIAVVGKFQWTPRSGRPPLVLSYTGVLIRQDGELRIRIEDESRAVPRA